MFENAIYYDRTPIIFILYNYYPAAARHIILCTSAIIIVSDVCRY